MPRNDSTFLSLIRCVEAKTYTGKWTEKPNNFYATELLINASKNETGSLGMPDLCYINEVEKIFIMIELKNNTSKQDSAITEIQWYLSFFSDKTYPKDEKYHFNEKSTALKFFENYKILGLAVSGDIEKPYGHVVDTFIIDNKSPYIKDMNISDLKSEREYLSLFRNIDKEQIVSRVSASSSYINNLLYNIKEDKRPTLLSILLISLYPSKTVPNSFKDEFMTKDNSEILDQIEITVKKILGVKGENIPQEKINMIISELNVFKHEKILQDSNTIKTILSELKDNVIPLFDETSGSYDIIGKFYQEFLRYAGMVDVQSGIVLTPEHVTDLFTELVPLRKDDIIIDTCCGTGSFLIAGMNKLLELNKVDLDMSLDIDRKKFEKRRTHVRSKQIVGNELKPHMYILSICNMLFRGDGKSNIFNTDFFSDEFDRNFQELVNNNITPTIGFINPPYSGDFTDFSELQSFLTKKSKAKKNSESDNKKPWMKEISFLEKLCNICTRYVVMIAPPQTFMGENQIRNRLLLNNSLKAVITMPKDLFQPNAATGSAIIVLKTHEPHDFDQKVVFYNLSSDGFELEKKKGRRDTYYKWDAIKHILLSNIDSPMYQKPSNVNEINNCFVKIKKNDEWLIQAFSKVEWSKLNNNDFARTVKSYALFKTKEKLDALTGKIDDVDLLTIFESVDKNSIVSSALVPCASTKEFDIREIFNDVRGCLNKITKKELKDGDYLYITTSNKNNGVSGYHNSFSEEGNVFTIDSATDGRAFFQESRFIGSDHVEILSIKSEYIEHLNKYTAMYLLTILNFYLDKYEYSRKRAQKRIRKEKIYLPLTSDKKIDWSYMESLIKSLPYSSSI